MGGFKYKLLESPGEFIFNPKKRVLFDTKKKRVYRGFGGIFFFFGEKIVGAFGGYIKRRGGSLHSGEKRKIVGDQAGIIIKTGRRGVQF